MHKNHHYSKFKVLFIKKVIKLKKQAVTSRLLRKKFTLIKLAKKIVFTSDPETLQNRKCSALMRMRFAPVGLQLNEKVAAELSAGKQLVVFGLWLAKERLLLSRKVPVEVSFRRLCFCNYIHSNFFVCRLGLF